MGPLSPQNKPMSFAALKAKKATPKITTKIVTVSATPKPKPPTRPQPTAPSSRSQQPTQKSSLSNGSSRHSSSTPRKSATPASVSSRQASREPIERLKQQRRNNQSKRASPAVSTPRLTSSDEESEHDEDKPRKRVRVVGRKESIDEKRQVRDPKAFSEDDDGVFPMVHAVDIANSTIIEQGRDKYQPFFTALEGDEDECPTIELQYPSAVQREKYQLVKPTDPSDFKPLDEIEANMKIVAEYYLDSDSASKVTSEEDGSGFVQLLHRQAMLGLKGRVGAQSKYIDVVEKYNALLVEKRKDGTIAKMLDQMNRVDLKLVEHIIKNQVYARTVSPQVNLVRHYEGFSDNVYGELLPKFLSRIFKQTGLKSDQVFIDMGSGVGNCVLQAALETGCESWGCEVMDNPNTLAQLQAKEFPARCHLWGIKPGEIHLIHGDFLKNEQVREVLKRADVILVNNQAFTAELNDKLKYVFLDVKEGAHIISLKPFRSPTHKIKDSNVNDPVNVLSVSEEDRWSGMVSWTDDPGKWYHQRKDSKELEAFVKSMEGSK
ncbi:Nucleosomal histone H3-Lys79 methylase [Exophiala dermatitidis]|uniref:Histone-lysine N-methyltransferase, H3 lysine-79 specific n=1 Tax=Exophiala dermatitidis TaxID=5970 RepID=A0AAN6ES54_EXODE|nr:Nucleosomal histone H3-Lys79 methylase [Exophiala dermatitidis]KAJ4512786.1 Nucleosomal histone H3-Lys79 methylase [Exophiala dermatitidis]KAJ4542594.1 Nucleosomal histone H3-Lys79 methylase [Exophiala dermatitidis]KAJ4548285.1 Nucleosomal histone H3-Lys79 methylase [Exophiala dermatitidis]KAJ4570183.1 Nucleosomal histone H3-Lys79 methylase [Exophiala dermatitidis]